MTESAQQIIASMGKPTTWGQWVAARYVAVGCPKTPFGYEISQLFAKTRPPRYAQRADRYAEVIKVPSRILLSYSILSYPPDAVAFDERTEPLPCPFCGGSASVYHPYGQRVAVRCDNKGCPTKPKTKPAQTDLRAIQDWNHRTPTRGQP